MDMAAPYAGEHRAVRVADAGIGELALVFLLGDAESAVLPRVMSFGPPMPVPGESAYAGSFKSGCKAERVMGVPSPIREMFSRCAACASAMSRVASGAA